MSAEIDEYPSLRFQDIREKPASRTGWTDGQRENSIPPPPQAKFAGGINTVDMCAVFDISGIFNSPELCSG